jgi:uncharacterized protein YbaR (Trm112 family)
MVNQDLLNILACSLCKSELRHEGETLTCSNESCGIVYTIKEDIPVMLIDEASRPCPKCSEQREWDNYTLTCTACGETYTWERT